MPASAKGRKWRRGRRFLRALRIGFLLLALFLVAAGTYLNEVGLPGFLKRPLLKQLEARGVDLGFTRLRLRWHRGIVAENVRLGPAHAEPSAPQTTLKEVEVKLNHAALFKFQLVVEKLILHDGQFVWWLQEGDQAAERLYATNIQAELRLEPDDQWELANFSADFAGARLRLSGSLTNATALRDWKWFQPGAPATPGLARARLRALARTLGQFKYTGTPELILNMSGDARDERSFHGLLTLSARGADTPWGRFTNGMFLARLIAPASATDQPQARFELRAEQALTPWGGVHQFDLRLQAIPDERLTNEVQARLNVSAARVFTKWAQADDTRFEAQWTHSFTNAIPLAGTGQLEFRTARTPWVSSGSGRIHAHAAPPATNTPPQADASWAWWAELEPWLVDWEAALKDVRLDDPQLGKLELPELDCAGDWSAPDLTITNLHARMYGGTADIRAAVNVGTRVLTFENKSDFDAHLAAPVLAASARNWLQQFGWEYPPRVRANGGLVLPAWTNASPDWQGEVLPSIWLQGELEANSASFRGVPVTSARTHFAFTNMVWNLPDLLATRPEGRLVLSHVSDERSQRFSFRVHSTIDVMALRGLLDTNAQHGLDFFQFTAPPVIDAEIWGKWREPEETGVKGHIIISNFTFRGESVSHVHTDIAYSNGLVQVTAPRIERGEQFMKADGLSVDIPGQKIVLTNGYGIMEPRPVLHAIGPRVESEMEPYRFLKPPTVRASGVIPLVNEVDADIHFQVDGGPFNWMKFNLTRLAGGVDWVGDHLSLTNVTASVYGGQMTGWAGFDFNTNHGADFALDLSVANSSLQALMADLSPGTNRLEGQLSGRLNVTRANTLDWGSWFGRGNATLRDGFIWEIPIFGVFSPVLDGFSPGLGRSRASAGTATFTITNSVIRSEDLIIQSPPLHMFYAGTVDFRGNVDAVVEAKLFRDTPLLGAVLSVALAPITKLFESKVTGTLGDPKREMAVPVIPKILLMPFNPIQTLKDMMPGEAPKGTYTAPMPPKKSP